MSKINFLNIKIANQRVLLWVIAFIITIGSVIYQRITGPTHPVKGHISIGETDVSFKLLRSEIVDKNAVVILSVPDTSISGYVQFRRYKSNDSWTTISLQREGDRLAAHLPKLSAAGKLMYYVFINHNEENISLSGDKPIILRYKGAVPIFILIPHVLFMFLAMFLSNRTGLEALDASGKTRKYMHWTIGLLIMGGFIFGPFVQKFAFDAFWTGIPFGHDLTDNKILIVVLCWLLAWFKNRKGKDGRSWIVFASILMIVVYLIPHSVLGSELDYTKLPSQ